MHSLLWDVHEHMSLDRNDTAWIWNALPHVHMYLNSWSPGTSILGSWGSRLLGNRVLDHSSVLLATWSLFYHTHWVVSNMVPHSCLPWYDGLSRKKKLPFRSKDWSSNWSSLRCLFCAFVCPVVVIFRVLILRQIFVLIPLSHPDATCVLHLPCGLCIIFLLLNLPHTQNIVLPLVQPFLSRVYPNNCLSRFSLSFSVLLRLITGQHSHVWDRVVLHWKL